MKQAVVLPERIDVRAVSVDDGFRQQAAGLGEPDPREIHGGRRPHGRLEAAGKMHVTEAGLFGDLRQIQPVPHPPADLERGLADQLIARFFRIERTVLQLILQDQIAQEDLLADAEIASRLGFRTLIIDDGWCIDERKRVSPQTLVNWYRWIGDWRISRKKFHDFPLFRRRIRELDMKLLFWVAPFFVGTDSEFRKAFPGCCEAGSHEGSSVMKSRSSDALHAQLEKMERVMREGELDGLKVDFLDSIAPSLEEPAGRIVMEFIRSLVRRVRTAKPDALLEFRQPYSNCCMIPYGTQFRAGDVPFDYLENFRRIASIRLCMGDRVPVHADPAYWHPEESPVNVARHMIAAIAGVPMLSMKLAELSQCHTQIVRHFLDFYREHRPTLNLGRWHIAYQLDSPAYLRADGESESIVFLLDETRLAEAVQPCRGRELFVLNLSAGEVLRTGCETRGPAGEAAAPDRIPAGGIGRFAE